jgi:hypothetical protein
VWAVPILCWFSCVLLFVKRSAEWRSSFLIAAIIWGFLVTAFTEFLSFFDLLNSAWLSACWASASAFIFFLFFISEKKRLTTWEGNPYSAVEKGLLLGVLFLCFSTFLTAVIAPPNNWDSMTYHMSRVVHWLQNGSVRHYPTHILRQLELNPWAEFAITQFQALSGNDRFANLVQWFSMVGSLIGATLIARQLGALRRGQILTAVILVSIPMGILQASSTQNDYVLSFWLLCFIWSGMRLKKTWNSGWLVITSASLGLAILTKGTAYLYALPFAFWLTWGVMKISPLRAITLAFAFAFSIFVLNSGHYTRNFLLFSNPLLAGESVKYSNEIFNAKSVVSNVIRNAAIHSSTPYDVLNNRIHTGVGSLHQMMSFDLNDQRTTFKGITFEIKKLKFDEDTSGNFFHALLAVIISALVFCRKSIRTSCPDILPYLLSVVAGFLLFCIFLRWQPWHSRLHLPLFVLGAPIAGYVLERLRLQGMAIALASFLLIAAFPWALRNYSRPLVPYIGFFHNQSPYPLTIISTDRYPLYFLSRPYLWKSYLNASHAIQATGARNIGLKFRQDDWEYPLWVLLKDNGSEFRIEHIDVENPSQRLSSHTFQPDLVLVGNETGREIAVLLPSQR